MALPGMVPTGLFAGEQLPVFAAGNVSFDDIYTLVKSMAQASEQASPAAGGTLTINSESLGSYDYTIKDGDQVISSFTNSDWFTTTEDTRAAFVVVKGDLTINSGQDLKPLHRKLFTVVYVAGNLSIAGTVSMTKRGANHGGTTKADIRIATGLFGGVTNPQIPSAGAAGGYAGGQTQDDGDDGVDGQTGGAGGGAAVGGGGVDGAGSDGTSFTGGVGGGGLRAAGGEFQGEPGGDNGGRGGDAIDGLGGIGCGGGAGNPAGNGVSSGGQDGVAGTGGVLLVVCRGALTGAGSIGADGANGGAGASSTGAGGGASGGGSVTVLYGSDAGVTVTALGGTGGTGSGARGGHGGDGTARKLSI